MKAKITWQEGVSFLGQVDSGHSVLMDGAAEAGGENLGPRPMEMILMGLGGCSAFDVVHILRKGRQTVAGFRVEMNARRAAQDPKIFTHIHLHFIITGKDLDSRQIERAINLSAEKYCSVSIMLKATVVITHDYEIIIG